MEEIDRDCIKMAKQISHDLKGTIAILQFKLNSLPHLSNLDKQELNESIISLHKISINLLKNKKNGHLQSSTSETITSKVTWKKPIPEIKINQNSIILIIDDDELMHEAWKLKLKHSNIPLLNIHHFLYPEDFNNWMNQHGHGEYGSRHYFFDYDLKNELFTGLDLIERHGLALESMLISGYDDDSEIFHKAKKLGIICLRKDLLHETSIIRLTESYSR